MMPMKRKKISYFNKKILRDRVQILSKIADLEKDFDGLQHNQPKDWAEVNNDTLERETIMQNIDMEKDNLRRVNQALRNLHEGRYGLCALCGQRIPEARLRVVPLANLCIKCQAKEETIIRQAS